MAKIVCGPQLMFLLLLLLKLHLPLVMSIVNAPHLLHQTPLFALHSPAILRINLGLPLQNSIHLQTPLLPQLF